MIDIDNLKYDFFDMNNSSVLFDKSELTEEQRTDPDYRLKSLKKQYGEKFSMLKVKSKINKQNKIYI